jgi:hypothetical protein
LGDPPLFQVVLQTFQENSTLSVEKRDEVGRLHVGNLSASEVTGGQ